jgi:(2Fe-2S) ferredoxin
MAKINSLEELRKLRDQAKESMTARSGEAKVRIRASMGTVGIAGGAREVLKAIIDELEKRNFHEVEIIEGGSMGFDKEEPVIVVERDGFQTTYGKVQPEMARQIVAQHVINGQIISEWVIARNKQ